MDYLSWELERQRAALRALLLVEGAARDGETVREGGRRSPETPGTARRNAAGRTGRYAGGGYTADFGAGDAWAAVREAGRDRPDKEGGSLETPAGAWERVLNGKAGSPEWEPEGGPAALRDMSREEAGQRAERSGVPGEAARPRAETATRAEGAAGRSAAKERPAESSGGGGTAGANAAVTRPARGGAAWTLGQDVLGGPRSGGPVAALQAEDGVKALSRAVQRDARRYDGGFTIY